MFTQDHRTDFDAVLNATEPFALVRFGDGEVAILDGRPHRSADDWRTKGPVWLQGELYETIQTNLPGFCLGLPPPCCLLRGLGLRGCITAPRPQHTFATLFLHGNLPRAPELRERFADAVVVNDRYGDILVPSDGVTEPWDVDRVVEQLLDVEGRPVLLAAGPCSNIIAYRYWKRQPPDKRVSLIDIGSVLDVLHGDKTRHYHGTMDAHVCYWLEKSGPTPAPVQQQRVATGNRLRIGRAEPSKNAQKIQYVRPRTRIGKR